MSAAAATPRKKYARLAAVAAIAACALLVAFELFRAAHHHIFFLGDFRAFYCGGHALAHGQDPYAAAPLRACEHPAQPFGLYSTKGHLAVPAPFPAYALAFFAAFTVLPYAAAAFLWLALILVCLAIAAGLLAKMSGRPFFAVLFVCIITYATIVLPLGQLTSIVLCALVVAGLAVRSERPWLAIAALCFAGLLPHVAMPVFLALFIWLKETRLPIAVAVAALTALDFFAGGLHSAISYFTTVLPAHATAEIGVALQYSFAWLAHAAGASSATALRLGEASYVIMLVAGIIAGGLLARRLGDKAFAVFIPAAFAVIGGTFIHMQEITLAFPAALLLSLHGKKTARTVAAIALILIAMPWLWVINQPWLVAAMAIATAVIATGIYGLDPARSLRAAMGSVALCACILLFAAHYGVQLVSAVPVHGNTALAQANWAKYVINSSGFTWLAGKIPTWIGLVLLIAASWLVVSDENHVTRTSVDYAPVPP